MAWYGWTALGLLVGSSFGLALRGIHDSAKGANYDSPR